MDSVLRAAALYLVLLVLFRIAGRRSLTDITTFDLLLLMIIGEATQQALLGDDFSLVNAVLVIVTLIVIDVGLSLLKLRHPKLDTLIEGSPTLIVEYGRPLHARLAEARLREEDILPGRPRDPRAWNAWSRSASPSSRRTARSRSFPIAATDAARVAHQQRLDAQAVHADAQGDEASAPGRWRYARAP
ncbi:membrane protein [Pseudomonas aeruginosa]|nr:membrane protein [Pseudomonas aeruginosa]